MKRYLLFCTQLETTVGGWDDLVQDSDDFQELKAIFEEVQRELEDAHISGTVPEPVWAHIVDTQTGEKKLYWTSDLGWCAA